MKPFPVAEIGSLPRFNWVVERKPRREEFYQACDALGVDPGAGWEPYYRSPAALMAYGGQLSPVEKAELNTFAGYLSVRALARLGLDMAYNGEQTRPEMSEAALRHIDGFVPVGPVVSWGSDAGWPGYLAFACAAEPRLKAGPYHQGERAFVQAAVARVNQEQGLHLQTKVIETGAVPLAIWNGDNFYYPRAAARYGDGEQAEHHARQELIEALDREAIIPVMNAHFAAGVDRLTIDLSRVSQHPGQLDLVVESIGRMNDAALGPFGLHFCFDDYPAIAVARAHDRRRLGDMARVQALYIESANTDDGRGRDFATYARHIRALREAGFRGEIFPGFYNVHTDEVEPVPLLAARMRAAREANGGLEGLGANPDCGNRTRPWPVVEQKLRHLVEAAEIVRAEG